jgi:hypothetical protein
MIGSPNGTCSVSYISLRYNGCISCSRKQLTLLEYFLRCRVASVSGRNTVAQMVEALRYKPERRGFDSRRGHCGLAVDSAGAQGWPSCAECLEILGPSTSWIPKGLCRDCFTFFASWYHFWVEKEEVSGEKKTYCNRTLYPSSLIFVLILSCRRHSCCIRRERVAAFLTTIRHVTRSNPGQNIDCCERGFVVFFSSSMQIPWLPEIRPGPFLSTSEFIIRWSP